MRQIQIAVLFIFCFLSSLVGADEVVCRDPNATDGKTGTWVTRFDVVDSAYGPMVSIKFLGYKSPTQTNPSEYFPPSGQQWRITYQPVDGSGLVRIEGNNSTMYSTPVAAYLFPQVRSPNGRCSMFPVAYKYRNYPGLKKVALIGDSISWNYNDTLTDRQRTADILGLLYRRQYHSATESGQVWYGNVLLPYVEGGNLADEARGLATDGANAMVFHLGSNDAGMITLSASGANRDAWRAAVNNAIWQTLIDVNSNNRCLILVTPSDYPVSYFGADPEIYRQEAIGIGNTLRFIANISTTDNVFLADWAELSRAHNGPNGDWFSNGDYLHPNTTGQDWLLGLWAGKLSSCKN